MVMPDHWKAVSLKPMSELFNLRKNILEEAYDSPVQAHTFIGTPIQRVCLRVFLIDESSM